MVVPAPAGGEVPAPAVWSSRCTSSRAVRTSARCAGRPPRRPTPATLARTVLIRDATAADWSQIWPFLRQIVAAAETYAYDPDMDEATARDLWLVGPPARTVVAVDEDGTMLGTANMYANRPGPGSHVASASFMVDPRASGRGVGRALGEEAIAWARAGGFRAMQFNAVVETNTRAVALWRSLGFEIIGTVPEAFRQPTDGYVGLHVMYRRL
jgi:L-amino acid N-acyltransferase YncA